MTAPTTTPAQPALEDFEVRKLAAIGAVSTSSGLVERRPIEYRRELENQFVRGFRAAESRLQAQVAAQQGDAEDAARYRWLRDGIRYRQGVPVSGHRMIPSGYLRALMEFNYWCTPEALDAAIDAERAALAQKEGK